jgi:signal transduction histidine kinase
MCASELPSDGDLVLWDRLPDARSLAALTEEEKWRHFFFVDRSDRERLHSAIPVSNANILLKPVTRAALMAFLTTACEQVGPVRTAAADPCRTSRDMLQCLIQTNLKLQEYDQDRTNFLARAIHDFRAPLTAISGYCDLMIGQDIGNLTEEQRDVLGRMQRSARKLSRMANAMFQLSVSPRVETSVELAHQEIRECVEQAVHEVLPASQDKRLTITTNVLAAPDPLQFDRAKIEQVIINLLDNACKFTPRGGHIDIRGYPFYWEERFGAPAGGVREQHGSAPNSYRIDIRDNGPGIPPAHLPRIFEEYTCYGGGADRSGGGLGLAICRMIVAQHKGRIWADTSVSGATFSFILPFHHQTAGSHQYFVHATNAQSL